MQLSEMRKKLREEEKESRKWERDISNINDEQEEDEDEDNDHSEALSLLETGLNIFEDLLSNKTKRKKLNKKIVKHAHEVRAFLNCYLPEES